MTPGSCCEWAKATGLTGRGERKFEGSFGTRLSHCSRSADRLSIAAEAPAPGASSPSGTNGAMPGEQERTTASLDALVAELARDSEIRDERVLAALRRVPRHRFVPEAVQDAAYENFPLPIGHGQTISQPAVVAVMTAAVAPSKSDRCLEIGTGSGYQAAVLAELCGVVYSIEYVDALARFAEANLRSTGYGADRVVLRTGDGYRGWPEAAPFKVSGDRSARSCRSHSRTAPQGGRCDPRGRRARQHLDFTGEGDRPRRTRDLTCSARCASTG